ncbi:unnamed protein product [Symbiodinium natans]|uniref:Uncharacterized protein n=1 Tax=Symbiodinium natans TaxID=878477 RepID=A0A812QTD6_9DINO|nr:unnamed protein product [Symbiodinium natans]
MGRKPKASSKSASNPKSAAKKTIEKGKDSADKEPEVQKEDQEGKADRQKGLQVVLDAVAFLKKKKLWVCDSRSKVAKCPRFPEKWSGSQVEKAWRSDIACVGVRGSHLSLSNV